MAELSYEMFESLDKKGLNFIETFRKVEDNLLQIRNKAVQIMLGVPTPFEEICGENGLIFRGKDIFTKEQKQALIHSCITNNLVDEFPCVLVGLTVRDECYSLFSGGVTLVSEVSEPLTVYIDYTEGKDKVNSVTDLKEVLEMYKRLVPDKTISALTSFGGLTTEQIEVIRQFDGYEVRGLYE